MHFNRLTLWKSLEKLLGTESCLHQPEGPDRHTHQNDSLEEKETSKEIGEPFQGDLDIANVGKIEGWADPQDELQHNKEEGLTELPADFYYVKYIKNHWKHKKKKQYKYLVKWTGYSEEEMSWEPEENIPQQILGKQEIDDIIKTKLIALISNKHSTEINAEREQPVKMSNARYELQNLDPVPMMETNGYVLAGMENVLDDKKNF